MKHRHAISTHRAASRAMLDSLLGLCPSADTRPKNKVLEDGNNRELAPAMWAVRIRASMGMGTASTGMGTVSSVSTRGPSLFHSAMDKPQGAMTASCRGRVWLAETART